MPPSGPTHAAYGLVVFLLFEVRTHQATLLPLYKAIRFVEAKVPPISIKYDKVSPSFGNGLLVASYGKFAISWADNKNTLQRMGFIAVLVPPTQHGIITFFI